MSFKRLAGDGAIYFSGAVLAAIVPFLLLPILTRTLGPAEFGLIGIFISLVGVLGAVVGAGTHGYVSVAYFRDGRDGMAEVLGGAIACGLIGAMLLLLLTTVFGPVIEDISLLPRASLWMVVAVAALQFLASIALALFQAMQRPWAYIAIQAGNALLLGLLTLLLLFGWGMGWEARALGQVASLAVTLAIAMLLIASSVGVQLNPARWPLRALLAFGVPLLPHSIAAIFIVNMDRFFLAKFSSADELGNYVGAAQIASLMTVVATAANQAWLPWLFARLKRNDRASEREIVRATWGVFAILALFALATIVLAPLLARIVLGPQYNTAAHFLKFLGPASAFGAAYLFVAGHLFYNSRTGLLSMISVTVAVCQFGLCWWLGQFWGASGIAAATLVSAALYPLLTWLAAAKVQPMAWMGHFRQAAD
jgi:O-antigen/teichoic acid export membrane protein